MTAPQPVQPFAPLYTVPEAARVLGIARSTLDLLIRRGDVESVLIGQRNRRVTGQALAAYLARAVDTAVVTPAPASLQPRTARRRPVRDDWAAAADAHWAAWDAKLAQRRRRSGG